MRALTLSETGSEDVLRVTELPTPEPGAGQVRIRVAGAQTGAPDVITRSGGFGPLPDGENIIGWDLSGTVDAVGDGVTELKTGDHVVAFSHWMDTKIGTQAEYVVLSAADVAIAPATVPLVNAATLPLNALTALQAVSGLEIEPGSTVFVTGAAGAVGSFAVQLAERAGYRVIGLARPGDADTLRERGITPVSSIAEAGTAVADAVLDPANIGQNVIPVIKDGGVYATFTGITPELERGIRQQFVEVESDREELAELGALVDDGTLALPPIREFAFEDAAEAHRLIAAGGLRERLVLVP